MLFYCIRTLEQILKVKQKILKSGVEKSGTISEILKELNAFLFVVQQNVKMVCPLDDNFLFLRSINLIFFLLIII